MFALLVTGSTGLLLDARLAPPTVPRATGRAPHPPTMKVTGREWEKANVPRGKVTMNPIQNMMQMQDQRIAGLSHINLAPGKCTLPLQEAIDLMKTWKAARPV